MSKSTTVVHERPRSPHLQIYRLIPTMVMSVLHRITGAALYFGSVLFVAWLLAAATSPSWFETVTAIYGSWFGRLVLFGFTFALIHHLLGGIRHLVWDTGLALEKRISTVIAKLTIVASITLTLAVWIVAYMVRGG